MKKNYGKAILETIRLKEQSNNPATVDARMVGFSDKTITRTRRKADEFGLTYEKARQMGYKKLARMFDAKRMAKRDMVRPDFTLVHKAMQSHKHACLIQLHHEYQLQHGDKAYKYSWFTENYGKFVKKIDIALRRTHHPGEQVFIDFAGKPVYYYDFKTGEKKKAFIFVGVLGCSQYTFAWACPGQTTEDWVEACVQMFKFFKGVPESIVPDNAKAVVTKAGKDLVLNTVFKAMAEHYAVLPIPTRVRKPKDKSLAELGVLFVTRWITVPLNRQKFFSIDEINAAIPELLKHLNERKFRRLPGNRVERYKEMDLPKLHPLPAKPFRRLRFVSPQKTDWSGHIFIDNHGYSVPFDKVNEPVYAWVNHRTIELMQDGLRIAVHRRSKVQGTTTTNPKHIPPNKKAYKNVSKRYYLEWAQDVGRYAYQAIDAQFKVGRNDTALRACEKLKKLAKRFGSERFESACRHAEKYTEFTAKSITSILTHKLDLYYSEAAVSKVVTEHENLRGSNYYGGKQ